MDYGYFVMKDFNYESLQKSVERVTQLIPELINMIKLDPALGESCYLIKEKQIYLIPVENMKKISSDGLKSIEKIIEKTFGIVNNQLHEYFMILHEYGHSVDPNMDINIYLKRRSLLPNDDMDEREKQFRQMPEEKFADQFAINFIKEHWDFLMS